MLSVLFLIFVCVLGLVRPYRILVCIHVSLPAHQKGQMSIHGRRDERCAPHVLCMLSVYVSVCDVHAITDRIGKWVVSDRHETGRTMETGFGIFLLYIERVNFPGRGMHGRWPTRGLRIWVPMEVFSSLSNHTPFTGGIGPARGVGSMVIHLLLSTYHR